MEQFSFWIQAIISVLSGIAVLIPLIIKMTQAIQQAVKEKNWSQILKLVLNLMTDAEEKFETGAERKEWVISQLQIISGSINYDIDWSIINEMIDKICDAAKEINK